MFIKNTDVVSVAEVLPSNERDELNKFFIVRDRTLDICGMVEGYDDLPLDEKNKIYDMFRDAVAESVFSK